ncbi:MAG: hypothetical protein V4481_00730 [Patescibacteria group bacterium]
MSYTTYTQRVRPAYSEDKEDEKKNDEKKSGDEKDDETDQAQILTDDEIDDLVARSGEVTWDEFFAIFDEQVA